MVGLNLAIRPWRADDRGQVELLLKLFSPDAAIRSNDSPTFVAAADDVVVGMVTLCLFTTLTGTKGYLDHLVVAPSHRRRAIGQTLVHHAIAHAKAAGASRIDLTAGPDKQAGRALYRSVGFCEHDTSVFRLELSADPTAPAD